MIYPLDIKDNKGTSSICRVNSQFFSSMKRGQTSACHVYRKVTPKCWLIGGLLLGAEFTRFTPPKRLSHSAIPRRGTISRILLDRQLIAAINIYYSVIGISQLSIDELTAFDLSILLFRWSILMALCILLFNYSTLFLFANSFLFLI